MRRLENWCIVFTDPWLSPEQQEPRICGEVYNHPHSAYEDGKRIVISAVQDYEGDVVITLSGNRYELGAVDEKYEAAYPDARNRLFKSLDEQKEAAAPKSAGIYWVYFEAYPDFEVMIEINEGYGKEDAKEQAIEKLDEMNKINGLEYLDWKCTKVSCVR